jgi:UDPglucose--hexose-1-phosphate uridylyltransferase
MSHLRKDPITNRWVIVAANRARRPGAFLRQSRREQPQPCPFCEGQESQTPAEVFAYRQAGTGPNRPGWRVRVVPNKFPALQLTENQPGTESPGAAAGELFRSMPGIGVHEVIIESPRHVASTSDLSVEEVAEVCAAYRQRLLDLRRDRRLAQPFIFKNAGEAAGASIEHTHSQLIVTSVVPVTVQEELSGALEFHRSHGRCVFCEVVRQELAAGSRVVLESPHFVAVCPFASRFAFETWLLPKAHASHYEDTDESVLDELAGVVKSVVTKIELVLDRPAYNYLIHTVPFGSSADGYYHWHWEFVPVLARTAGFELGSGYYINPVPPEDAAARLRKV